MHNASLMREGVIAGVLGAVGVALWFLLVDAINGTPLYTPALLGEGVLSVFGVRRSDDFFTYASIYTVFHFVAFIVIGIIAAAIVHMGEREPAVLAGALILFVAIQVAFYGFTALLSQSDRIGDLAWYQVGIANLIAATLMGVYLWRAHPALGRRMDFALGGGER